MRALTWKLLRDLVHLRGQLLAIAMVIAGGVASYIMAASTLEALRITRDRFYAEYNFAEVFASAERVPNRVAAELEDIPGVRAVETRVIAPVSLDVADFPEPVQGRLVSIPERNPPTLNRVFLRSGRMPEPGAAHEALVGESFAQAHDLGPGDTVGAIINGRREELRIVGIGLSPDFIFQLGGGSSFPDEERFGMFWMHEEPLAGAFDMEGAFNDVSMSLEEGASTGAVIERVDLMLDRYGGLGAYDRMDQVSHRFLHEEFRQLENMATMIPAIFLGVAAFLLNVVVTRLIGTEREQIATLKAFGYGNFRIGMHYAGMIFLVCLGGTLIGTGAGYYVGRQWADLYAEFYHFPFLDYRLRPGIVLIALGITMGAAVVGTFRAVRAASRLAPAQAMRPEEPAMYRKTLVERLGLQRFLSQPSRMILRDLERRPGKAALSALGIASSAGIVILATFFIDAMTFTAETEFGVAQRQDYSISFSQQASWSAVHEVLDLPGASYAEPFRAVPVTLRNGTHSFRTSIEGLVHEPRLRRVIDTELRPVPIPPEGILLTDYLAEELDVGAGDTLTVEVMEGSMREAEIVVAGTVSQFIGVGGWMHIDSLNRLAGNGRSVSGVYLAADQGSAAALFRALKEVPIVSGVQDLQTAKEKFYETIARQLFIFVVFAAIFASLIAFGVVYNSARISLSERGRELASLRVLGLTRGEISYILLGEQALLTLAAIPVGFVMGWLLSAYLLSSFETELFRIPLVIHRRTYAFAAAVVLAASTFSALVVRRRLDRLDLISVLKTRE